MKKITWITNKKIRCKNCKYFKLYVDKYESKHIIKVKCSNCGAAFYYSDIKLTEKINANTIPSLMP